MNDSKIKILDACCGPKKMWFDKHNPLAIFMDIRSEEHVLCDGRTIDIRPDFQGDFRNMPFDDNTFKLVLFDPPHLRYIGDKAYMTLTYGKLESTWEEDLKKGFDECMRVLEPYGVLIFKWNEHDIKVKNILEVIRYTPLFGHKSGKLSKTHWMCFMKIPDNAKE